MINGKDRETITKSAIKDVERLIKRHIDRFNNILYNTQISRDLFSFKHKKLISKVKNLTELIENELYNLCIDKATIDLDEEEDEDSIIAYLNSKRESESLIPSIKEYVGLLNSEIEAYIESSMYFDISVPVALNNLKNNLKSAYNTDLIRKAYKEIEKPNNIIIKSKGVTVDKGQYKTSNANLKRLIGFMVIDALTHRQMNHFERLGAIGFDVHRGSSYPCGHCDSYVGFHTMDDVEALPPRHGNCYCYITPVLIN